MDALSVTPIGPATLSALSGLRPVQPLVIQGDKTSGSSTLSIQDLAQGLFQQALQATTLSPVTDASTAAGNIGLGREATASLLATLTAPQASADATPTPQATTNSVATTAASSSPSANPATTGQTDLLATQDAVAASSTTDFALQTALRFGAGVTAQANPAPTVSNLGASLVRDAAAVQRLGNLQPGVGGPGPEAYTPPPALDARVLRSYETLSALSIPPATGRLDLLA